MRLKALTTLFSGLFYLLLRVKRTQAFALKKLDEWGDVNKPAVGWRVLTARKLQRTVSTATGGHICNHCKWNIPPGEYHELCEVMTMSTRQLMMDTARLIVERNAAADGLTVYEIENGMYFKTCGGCGEQYWGEDGCGCRD